MTIHLIILLILFSTSIPFHPAFSKTVTPLSEAKRIYLKMKVKEKTIQLLSPENRTPLLGVSLHEKATQSILCRKAKVISPFSPATYTCYKKNSILEPEKQYQAIHSQERIVQAIETSEMGVTIMEKNDSDDLCFRYEKSASTSHIEYRCFKKK